MSADPQLDHWQAQWQRALQLWSDHLQLQEPLWLFDVQAATQAGLTDSFAAIRLTSQRVMVNLQDITQRGLDDYALEVLAHEIGHHVYAPANMTQHLQLLAVIRQALPGSEQLAPLVANLYTDLLINQHLQRNTPCQMDAIYQRLKPATATPLWQLYMRIYERLWQLPPETLTSAPLGSSEEGDAWLGSRIIKVYGKDWLTGASRFATLLLRYLQNDEQAANDAFGVLADTADAGNGHTGTGVPALPAIDVLHPSLDPELSEQTPGTADADGDCSAASAARSAGQALEPQEYYEVMRAAGVDISRHDATVNYYRDAVRPYLLPFPAKSTPAPSEPEREGTALWEPGDDPAEIDWFATLLAGGDPIPGITTHKAVFSRDGTEQPRHQVCDLDLYVDSSGSMPNPQYQLSYPALAGVLLCMSALRAGAQVQVTLWSGARQCLTTDGFIRDEAGALRILTGFFGGSTSFPLKLLRDTYAQPRRTPTQVVVLSDDGVSSMFADDEEGTPGAEISARTLRHCGGAGHWVLDLPMELDSQTGHPWLQGAYEKMRVGRDQGWQVHRVNGLEPMLTFARHFSRQYYQANDATAQRATRP
ncbi:MAG TPA: hypothetical protein DEP32_03930 [Pseudomonas sp.]|nr:hypothetical protein [Pseudomonas sp.]HCA23296.1 hypothetical protein [Pseudomonas sp.]|tara:strand:+ start:2801 stop:4573 length:1773 start_codon:yes stop_codon:yes gene_type:complete